MEHPRIAGLILLRDLAMEFYRKNQEMFDTTCLESTATDSTKDLKTVVKASSVKDSQKAA